MSGQTTARLLSVAEFAILIGRAERQVRRYVSRGEIAARTEEVNGRTVVRIPEEEANKFLRGETTVSPDDADICPDDPPRSSGQPPSCPPDSSGPSGQSNVVSVLMTGPLAPGPDDRSGRSGPSNGHSAVLSGQNQRGPAEAAGPSGQREVDATEVSGPAAPQYHITAGEILVRYEAAAMRLGWVEGQLEMTRKMLGDGGQKVAEMQEKEHELQRRLDAEAEARRQAEAKAADAQARLEAMESMLKRSWWEKLFRPV